MTTEGNDQYLSVTQGNMHWLFRNVSRDREDWTVSIWQIHDRDQDNDGVFHANVDYTADEIIDRLWI